MSDIPWWFRFLDLASVVIAVLCGIMAAVEFARGSTVRGVYFIGLGAVVGLVQVGARRHRMGVHRRIPMELQALMFFLGCVIVGVVVAILDFVGSGHGGPVVGVIALVGVAIGVRNVVYGLRAIHNRLISADEALEIAQEEVERRGWRWREDMYARMSPDGSYVVAPRRRLIPRGPCVRLAPDGRVVAAERTAAS